MLETSLKTTRNDMRTLVKDAQNLFREATMATGVKADELRTKGIAMLDTAIAKAQDMQAAAIDASKELAQSTDAYVRENPWRAVVISAVVGLIAGMAISRK